MSKIIFDIETIGENLEVFDDLSKEYLFKYEEDEGKVEESLSFSPLTAQIIAIGILDPDIDKGKVYFQAPDSELKILKEGEFEFIPATEKGILEGFWREVKDKKQFITFNGRAFDCPFIMIRSAILKVKPSKNLMPYRYSNDSHIDLLDQLTFYGAMRRKFNLHMWCRAFGIESPKEKGMTGEEVRSFFKEKRYLDISRYCLADVKATKELYLYWDRFLKF